LHCTIYIDCVQNPFQLPFKYIQLKSLMKFQNIHFELEAPVQKNVHGSKNSFVGSANTALPTPIRPSWTRQAFVWR